MLYYSFPNIVLDLFNYLSKPFSKPISLLLLLSSWNSTNCTILYKYCCYNIKILDNIILLYLYSSSCSCFPIPFLLPFPSVLFFLIVGIYFVIIYIANLTVQNLLYLFAVYICYIYNCLLLFLNNCYIYTIYLLFYPATTAISILYFYTVINILPLQLIYNFDYNLILQQYSYIFLSVQLLLYQITVTTGITISWKYILTLLENNPNFLENNSNPLKNNPNLLEIYL